MKKFSSSFRRRIATIVLLAGITGTFLSVYYFVYLPRQREQFNAGTFRLLNNITTTFVERVTNFGDVTKYAQIGKDLPDSPFVFKDSLITPAFKTDDFNSKFRNTFYISIGARDRYKANPTFEKDFIIYNINDTSKKIDVKDTVYFKELLDPLTALYKKTFAGIFVFKQNDNTSGNHQKPDKILYSPQDSELNIGDIYTDSLFPDKNMQVPVVIDTRIDDIPFKFFLVPFKMQLKLDSSKAGDESNIHTFVMSGLMDVEYYNEHIQSIPFFLLGCVLFVIALIILSLPFLKIFLISSKESLKLTDIRSVIAVIFISPFIFTLFFAAIWIYHSQQSSVTEELQTLHKHISNNFYGEIQKNLKQQRLYDSLIRNPFSGFSVSTWNENKHKKNYDAKDMIFYPAEYKHFTNLHWMDSYGNDVAVWNMKARQPATYFNVATRSYFLDVKYNRLRVLPEPWYSTMPDSFGIQPIISRLTGDYTISISRRSDVDIKTRRAIASAMSSKMYSVVNPVIADGYSFCIIDSLGLILCHSDSVRSLQENIFKESGNNFALRNAVNHKDSAIIGGINLDDQNVRLMIKPMPGLPYYLITYHRTQKQNLFLFHVIGFAFVSEIILLILASVFAYFITLSKKRLGRLSFEPLKLNWLKPSPSKTGYYVKNSIQLLVCLLLVKTVSVFYTVDENRSLFWLNSAALLPVFVVFGYYLIKSAKAYFDIKNIESPVYDLKNLISFVSFSRNIFLLYLAFIIFYLTLDDRLFYHAGCVGKTTVKAGILLIIIMAPVLATLIAGWQFKQERFFPHYLHCFIISLLLASMMISVVPSLALLNFAYREEEKLQVQSAQIDLARKIQQRRSKINSFWWTTKLDPQRTDDSCFISQMKFDTAFGLYPGSTDIVKTVPEFKKSSVTPISCSPFFRIITQTLFLPPEHDDFYDDHAHQDYYYWNTNMDSNAENWMIALFYRNTTDFRDKAVINIETVKEKKYLFRGADFFGADAFSFLFLIACVLLFYKIIASTTKRIFLLDYFSRDPGVPEFEQWLELHKTTFATSRDKVRSLLGLKPEEKFSFEALRKKELEWIRQKNNAEESILELHLAMKPVFEQIWQDLDETEKYVLYDFATDGFTNYKNMLVLNVLYDKGLLVKEEDQAPYPKNTNLTFMSMAFRNFLLTKENAEEIKKQSQENKSSSWSTLRLVFIMMLIAFAVFLLITQQEATQRIVTIVTTLGTLLPLVLKLFDTSSSGATAKKTG